MNFKLYNTVTNKCETQFKILPNGDVENEWGGVTKPDDGVMILLVGTGVMDGDREIFEHDLYVDEYDNQYEVVFYEGGFYLEVDFLCLEDFLMLSEIRQRGLQYVCNAYIDPEIYQKYKNDE